jgi:hypothetical protein
MEAMQFAAGQGLLLDKIADLRYLSELRDATWSEGQQAPDPEVRLSAADQARANRYSTYSAYRKEQQVKATPDPNVLLTAEQVAQLLTITVDQVLAFTKDGSLRYINGGRGAKVPRYRYSPQDVETFKEQGPTEKHHAYLSQPEEVAVLAIRLSLQTS